VVDIIPFEPNHLTGILDLCRDEAWPTFPEAPERALRSLTAPGVVATVALEGTRVIGLAQALTDGVIQAHLSLLATAHDRRGQGIGRRLVTETLRRSGVQRIDLVTDSAEGFYTSMPHRRFAGFRIYTTAGTPQRQPDPPPEPLVDHPGNRKWSRDARRHNDDQRSAIYGS